MRDLILFVPNSRFNQIYDVQTMMMMMLIETRCTTNNKWFGPIGFQSKKKRKTCTNQTFHHSLRISIDLYVPSPKWNTLKLDGNYYYYFYWDLERRGPNEDEDEDDYEGPESNYDSIVIDRPQIV